MVAEEGATNDNLNCYFAKTISKPILWLALCGFLKA